MKDVEVWTILFTDTRLTGDRLPWWDWERWFTRPGFAHCMAVGKLPSGQWITVDVLRHRVDIRVLDEDTCARIFAYLIERGATAVDARVERRRRPPRFFPIYCVTFMQYLIGVRSFCVTPYQLYRFLRRRAAAS